MFNRILLTIFLCTSMRAGVWKASLNFHLDGQPFERNSLHIALSKRARQEVEKWPNEVFAVSAKRAVTHDNVGNLFFEDRSLHQKMSVPTNKENIALARLEVLFKGDGTGEDNFSSMYIELQDEIGGTVKRYTPFFSSNYAHLSGVASDRLTARMGRNIPSKPSSFDGDDFSFYHKSAHAEDKIFYLVSRCYEGIVRGMYEEQQRDDQNLKIRAVILHVHTRFDMCGSCAYSLDWELRHGFGQDIHEFCGQLNQDRKLPVDIAAMVSSRQDFLVWGPSRRTLPVPPLVGDVALSERQLRAEYGRVIDFAADLSAPKTFAQYVVSPFA